MKALSAASAFERVLRVRACARSSLFALHHLSAAAAFAPAVPAVQQSTEPGASDLSTISARSKAEAVDNIAKEVWLGCVVPKRLARRAVTRNLLKRQVRACAERAALGPGAWVVRLKEPVRAPAFVSAASPALRLWVRGDLHRLFAARGPAPVAATTATPSA